MPILLFRFPILCTDARCRLLLPRSPILCTDTRCQIGYPDFQFCAQIPDAHFASQISNSVHRYQMPIFATQISNSVYRYQMPNWLPRFPILCIDTRCRFLLPRSPILCTDTICQICYPDLQFCAYIPDTHFATQISNSVHRHQMPILLPRFSIPCTDTRYPFCYPDFQFRAQTPDAHFAAQISNSVHRHQMPILLPRFSIPCTDVRCQFLLPRFPIPCTDARCPFFYSDFQFRAQMPDADFCYPDLQSCAQIPDAKLATQISNSVHRYQMPILSPRFPFMYTDARCRFCTPTNHRRCACLLHLLFNPSPASSPKPPAGHGSCARLLQLCSHAALEPGRSDLALSGGPSVANVLALSMGMHGAGSPHCPAGASLPAMPALLGGGSEPSVSMALAALEAAPVLCDLGAWCCWAAVFEGALGPLPAFLRVHAAKTGEVHSGGRCASTGAAWYRQSCTHALHASCALYGRPPQRDVPEGAPTTQRCVTLLPFCFCPLRLPGTRPCGT